MTICLKQILFHQEQLKSNLKELFSHFGKYVKQYTNIFAEVGGLLGNPFTYKSTVKDDFNNYINTGLYRFTAMANVINNPGFYFGQLRVYNDNYYVIQEAVDATPPFNLRKRRKENNIWTEWK